jgi:tetratricopeptide (TPR) repeat protein
MERFAEAEAAFRKTLELAPQRVVTRGYLSMTLLAQGRSEEALAEAKREPEEQFRLWTLAVLHHALGHRAESDAALHDLIATHATEAAVQIADAYATRGEVDRAFEWLERAHAQRDGGLVELKVCPHFRSLHGDPRWGAFLTKMGFDE